MPETLTTSCESCGSDHDALVGREICPVCGFSQRPLAAPTSRRAAPWPPPPTLTPPAPHFAPAATSPRPAPPRVPAVPEGEAWVCGDCGAEWIHGDSVCSCCGGATPCKVAIPLPRKLATPAPCKVPTPAGAAGAAAPRKGKLSRHLAALPKGLVYGLGIPLALVAAWILLPFLWEVFLAILSMLMTMFVIFVIIAAILSFFFR